ncbi:MAG: VWA domain-containing protein [Candidatus Micrarchaeota archaeon]|nr:VWA domain-containing protein [Candidatus Micrarchaeota archaeon]
MGAGMLSGQFSFLTKGFLLIFVMISIALIINQITFYQYGNEKISREYDLASATRNIASMISASKDCLASVSELEEGTSGASRVLDIDKIKRFSTEYNETEPPCARNYLMGYNVTIELLPLEMSYEYTPPEDMTILQRMVKELSGRGAVFAIDMSYSMRESIGGLKKVECIKKFLNGFAENLEKNSKMAIIGYGSSGTVDNDGCDNGVQTQACDLTSNMCGTTEISSPIVIEGNEDEIKSRIEKGVVAEGCTPMSHGLVAAYSVAQENGIKDIVLLTDGCENCGGDSICVVQKHLSSDIRVHTIGFGERACDDDNKKNCICEDTLETISSTTGGKSFMANGCEELVRSPSRASVIVGENNWSFGANGHSVGKALDSSITMSFPVAVKNGTNIFSGLLKITGYEGDLETIAGLIDYACAVKKEAIIDTFIDSQMTFNNERKQLCMKDSEGHNICRKVSCDEDIVMDDITNKGRYKIVAKWSDEKVVVLV